MGKKAAKPGKKPTASKAASKGSSNVVPAAIAVAITGVALYFLSGSDDTATPAKAQYKHHNDAVPADPRKAQTELIRPTPSNELQMWDPVAINFTRHVVLDDSGRTHKMRTMALDPPIFEIENFLTEAETKRIMKMANKNGMAKSDHTFLDGSNYDDKDKNTKGIMDEGEANKLFRHSDQAWLSHDSDPFLQKAIARVMNLGLLPPGVRRNSEAVQVVKYGGFGHYESHHDSEPDGMGPCCVDAFAKKHGMQTGVYAIKSGLNKRCRLCRFMTVIYYLVDTDEGGGTVFPLADTSDEILEQWETSSHPLKYKQTRTCVGEDPNRTVVVKPKRGKAIIWYNHKIDRGHLGPLDVRSLHGACNVGETSRKWIANHWMSATEHPDIPREFAKRGF